MSRAVIAVLLCFLACFSNSLTIQNDSTSTQLAELRQEVRNLKQRLDNLNTTLQKERTDHVMFYAVMREKSYTYNVDTILVFETVIVNEGGFYDKYDGVFVAPQKGTYMFSWTVSGNGANWMVSELVVESQVISSAGVYNAAGGHSSGSMTAFCKMEQDDHAWIRTTGVTSSHMLYSKNDFPQSSFLGLLIYSV